MTTTRDPNIIVINDTKYVLVWAAFLAEAVHLVRAARDGEPTRPIAEEYEGGKLNPAYSRKALKAAEWSRSTLCGRPEWGMAATEVGGTYAFAEDYEAAETPTCEVCLGILDREFPAPEPDDRLAENIARCLTELDLWGTFMIDHVPGDQMRLLRLGVRKGCRERGWQIQTIARENRLLALSKNSLNPNRVEFVEADSRMRMRGLFDTNKPVETPSWHFSW